MKKTIKILPFCLLLFMYIDGFSQQNKDIELLYCYTDSIDQKTDFCIDTVYIGDKVTKDIALFQNTFYFRNIELLHLENIDYYLSILLLEYKSKKYLHIYPKYIDFLGPYMWFELGYLIEFKEKKIIVRSGYDYVDLGELYWLFRKKKSIKLEKEILIEKNKVSNY